MDLHSHCDLIHVILFHSIFVIGIVKTTYISHCSFSVPCSNSPVAILSGQTFSQTNAETSASIHLINQSCTITLGHRRELSKIFLVGSLSDSYFLYVFCGNSFKHPIRAWQRKYQMTLLTTRKELGLKHSSVGVLLEATLTSKPVPFLRLLLTYNVFFFLRAMRLNELAMQFCLEIITECRATKVSLAGML